MLEPFSGDHIVRTHNGSSKRDFASGFVSNH